MINSYATLAEYKAFITPRGQTISTDAADDALVSSLLEEVSDNIYLACHRTFYPRYEVRKFNVPNNPVGELTLDDDLLEVVTLTNGDGTVIAPADFNLIEPNLTPHYAISLVRSSSLQWLPDDNGNLESVILVEGWWGYHNRYAQRGWTQVGTLGAAISTTTSLTLTMAAAPTIAVDTIVKIDNEIFNVTVVNGVTVTVSKRGDNGSTAATHLIAAPVYQWNVMPAIKKACLQNALKLYDERLGVNVGPMGERDKYTEADVTAYERRVF